MKCFAIVLFMHLYFVADIFIANYIHLVAEKDHKILKDLSEGTLKRSSLIYNTSARHKQYEHDTNAALATRVRHEPHECDTSVTQVRHEWPEYDKSENFWFWYRHE